MIVCLACYGERVAALLEGAAELRFYRTEAALQGGVSGAGRFVLPAPPGQAGLAPLLDAMRAAGAGVLICGGLTCCAQEALERTGLVVLPWMGGAADEVAMAWAKGRMDAMRMPGCACRGRKRRRATGAGRTTTKETDMNSDIIAVTSEGPALTDMVDPRFGRAAGFVIVDMKSGAHSYVDNGGSQAMAQGAGIQAAENVARAGAGAVLSGFVGPKAFQALAAAGITVVQNVEDMTVAQAVEKYRRGEFAAADAPNAQAGGRH